MRKQPPPDIRPPQVTHQIHDTTVEQRRKYRIITPLFGGGATPQMCDEITTVRGTEIRGHLRFWWRATCADHVADVEAVKEREGLIWGKANKKKEQGPKREETLQIEVSLDKESERVAPFKIKTVIDHRDGKQKNRQEWIPSTKVHDYAAFSLQWTQDELKQTPPPPPRTVSKEGIEFTVTITFPRKYADEVKMALWAWEIFGGIGARTRRGFGALQLLEIDGKAPVDDTHLPPSFQEAKQWLAKKLEKLPAKNHGFPYISPQLHFRIIEASDPMNGWEALIEKLMNFRQGSDGRPHNRNAGNKPGRSYWPEAETVRALTGERRSDLPALGHPEKFPRAAFGLPITFHFMRDPQHNTNNPRIRTNRDPADAFLQAGGGSDRLASPLILKPLPCQNGQACGLAVILDGCTIPSSVMLKEKNGKTHPSLEHQLDNTDLKTLSSLKLNNKVDVLEAFLDYVGGNSK